MSRIERSVDIAADLATVWTIVADLEGVVDWNPNVSKAVCGPGAGGIGATRSCELAPKGRIDEVVSHWVEHEQIWMAIGSHGGVRSADMGLELDSSGGVTTVTAIADYHLAFGPLGPVIDRLTMKRMMGRMLAGALEGLKQHIEQATTTQGENG